MLANNLICFWTFSWEMFFICMKILLLPHGVPLWVVGFTWHLLVSLWIGPHLFAGAPSGGEGDWAAHSAQRLFPLVIQRHWVPCDSMSLGS
jgi:hypothetical protein